MVGEGLMRLRADERRLMAFGLRDARSWAERMPRHGRNDDRSRAGRMPAGRTLVQSFAANKQGS
ncbi:hypothetical protein XFLAVUS301_41600 [Xanthobacter flavus]|uniref:Uncharacterized protein n=1 Tax=Xanthobacter flavus TaxID=281 RepID=A0A9W6CQW6_XANFL|nr:hypothetical protein XFLAVUS301_41600 [Xanthobacter flavus]